MKTKKLFFDTSPKKTVLCLALTVQSLSATPALAAPSDDDVQELRAMIEKLQRKIDDIESRQNKAAPAAPSSEASGTPEKPGNLLPPGLNIYGALDSGVEMVTNVGEAKKTLNRVPSITGYAPSNVGLDIRYNVNSSIAAVGKAEMGIYMDSGNSGQGSRLFGRQLFVGVDTPLGILTFGRQYTMLLYGLYGGDILGPNIYSLGSIDAYIPNARVDNSVAWRAKFDKFSLGAHYSFGRDSATASGSATIPGSGSCTGEDAVDASRCRSWSAMVRYDDDPRYGISLAIDSQRGGTGAQASFFNGSAPIKLTDGNDDDRRITANGYLRFGALKLGAGWGERFPRRSST